MNIFKYILLSIFLISSATANKEDVTLQLQWKHQFQFAGYYMAKEKGYYDEVNLNVKFAEYNDRTNNIDDILSQKINYAIGRSSLIIERSHGKKIVLLSSILQSSPLAFVTKKSSNIKRLKDFKNKRITMTKNEADTSLFPMLLSEKINKNDLIINTSKNKVNDLLNNKTDIITLYRSNQEYSLIQKNIDYIIFDPKDYDFDFYDDILFTSKNELSQHKERTIKFKNASLKGWKYAYDNIDETIKVILKNYNTQNKSYSDLLYEANILKKLSLKDNSELGNINQHKIKRIYDIYHLMGLVKNPIDVNKFIVKESTKELSKKILNIYSKEEKTYLEKHKIIKMCHNPNAEPIEFAEYGDINNISGITIDIIRKIEKQLHIRFQTIPTNTWKESQQYLKEKRCDILSSAHMTNEIKKYANLTQPYLNLPFAIFTAKNKPLVNGFNDVSEYKWSRRKDSEIINTIKQKYPNTDVLLTKNVREALQLVNTGKVYFTIATLPVASNIISKYQFDNIQIAGYTKLIDKLSIAVKKDDIMLKNILDKALKNLSAKEQQDILNYWTTKNDSSINIILLRNIFIILFIIVLLLIYRQYLLNKANANLKKLVNEKTQELQDLNIHLEHRIQNAINENREKDKLLNSQSKMASMGEMIGNIAHQWRQPLSVISTGVTGMQLQKEYDLLDDAQFNKTCIMINNNAQYLSKTIDDFQNYIKGNQQKDIFNISNSIHTFIHLVEGSIKENNIDVILYLDDQIEILGFKNELVQCYLNIYNNAKDALKEKQKNKRILIIKTQIVKNKLNISFQDNAKGIKKSVMNKVFEPYFTTKHKSQGTGLGLHMTYKLIVDSMQGEINVENKSFKYKNLSYYGANFKIILPLNKN